MDVTKTDIEGLVILTPARFSDARGFFSETWNKARLESHGISIDFCQDNHSVSMEANTIRGLHYQTPPHGQAKLVRCGRGRLFDVAVDIRTGSASYGKWFGVELSFENGKQLLIPEGFMHGFATLEPETEIIYKCSDYYAPDCDRAVRFDDPDIAIEWPANVQEAILSDKDLSAPLLREQGSPFEI